MYLFRRVPGPDVNTNGAVKPLASHSHAGRKQNKTAKRWRKPHTCAHAHHTVHIHKHTIAALPRFPATYSRATAVLSDVVAQLAVLVDL
jgi:hypothetical protein